MTSLRETVDRADNRSIITLLLADFLDKNFIITKIEPHIYRGLSTGADFNVFDANILYFGIELNIGGDSAFSGSIGSISLFDKSDGLIFKDGNVNQGWDGVGMAVGYIANHFTIKNIYFNRYADAQYDYINFIGYKITYQ